MPTPQDPVFVDPADTIHFLDAPVGWTQPVPELVAGVASITGSTANSVSLSATNASGGVPGAASAYSYQWERKLGAAGAFADVAGATALTLNDAGLAPGSYTYRLRYTDRLGTIARSNEVAADLSSLTRIIADLFSGTDTLSIAGRTPDTANIGTTWGTLFGGGLGLSGDGIAYCVNPPAASVIQSNQADCEVVTKLWVGTANGRDPYVIVRASDANNYIRIQLDTTNDEVRIHAVINGSLTLLTAAAYTLSPNDQYTVRVVLQASAIQVYLAPGFANPVLVAETSAATHNQAATKHGAGGTHGTANFFDFEVWV